MMTQPDGDIRRLRRQSYQRPGARAATLCTIEGRDVWERPAQMTAEGGSPKR